MNISPTGSLVYFDVLKLTFQEQKTISDLKSATVMMSGFTHHIWTY